MVVVERRLCDSDLWKAVILQCDVISGSSWTMLESFDGNSVRPKRTNTEKH